MILVTGGAGFIGSHTVVELLTAGYAVHIVDNFSNSSPAVIDRIERIVKRSVPFTTLDIRDAAGLRRLFRAHCFDSVIHFAGLKAVGESILNPLRYYDHNVVGSLCLLKSMEEVGVKRLVFSSSATVYGDPHALPIKENFPLMPTNTYGRTKLATEDVLRDLASSDNRWSIALLRYFNPVGAHSSGLIGESPTGTPNNLMPYVTQVAAGVLQELSIFGSDYETVDGTGVRDYIHVSDLAKGHVAAVEMVSHRPGVSTINLGTGRGFSVLEVVRVFEQSTEQRVPYRLAERRRGDVAECYADVTLANELMGWRATRGLEEMCRDAWRWQSMANQSLN
jgi:UDP-glucose 4-epimerase